jgi:hypothetical protein
MNCPFCKEYLEESRCQNCGYDLAKCRWQCITKVYPPDDIVIESMLKSSGIPVRLLRREVAQIPVGIGPMAETRIYVPEIIAEEASALVENNYSSPETD